MQLSYTRNPVWLWERRALPYSESMRCDFPFAFPSWSPHSLWMFSGWRDAYKCGNRFGTGVHPLWHPPVSELQQGCRIRNLFRHKIYAKKTTHGVAVIYGVLCPFVGQVEPCLHQIHPQHRLDTPNRSPMLSTGWSLPSCWEIPPASSSFSGFRIQHPSRLSDLSYRTPALLCFPLLYYFLNIFARLTLISVSLRNATGPFDEKQARSKAIRVVYKYLDDTQKSLL